MYRTRTQGRPVVGTNVHLNLQCPLYRKNSTLLSQTRSRRYLARKEIVLSLVTRPRLTQQLVAPRNSGERARQATKISRIKARTERRRRMERRRRKRPRNGLLQRLNKSKTPLISPSQLQQSQLQHPLKRQALRNPAQAVRSSSMSKLRSSNPTSTQPLSHLPLLLAIRKPVRRR